MISETRYYFLIIRQLFFLLMIYSFCRLLFWLFNQNLISDPSFVTFIHGIRFDLSSIMLLNGVYLLLRLQPFRIRYGNYYHRSLNFLFIITNAFALFWNIVDLEYFKFTSRRTTWGIFTIMSGGDDLLNLTPGFLLDYWYLVIIFLLAVFILIKGFHRFNFMPPVAPTLNLLVRTLLFILGAGAILLGARGGLQLKPLHILHAATLVPAREVPLVLNTPFSMIKSLDHRQKLPEIAAEPPDLHGFSPVKQFGHTDTLSRNIMLIILESFSTEYTSAGGGVSFTPFLDSLASWALTYPNAYASGKQSIDGIPAIISSIPAWEEVPFAGSPYMANRIDGIPAALKSAGYYSVFYHGARRGTMNFEAFGSMAGFDDYKSLEDYPYAEEHYDGHWGIFDEPYLKYVAEDISGKTGPFFATVFTLSSHHPFAVPDSLEDRLPSGPLPIHRSVAYTDQALQKFFHYASTFDWYRNTVFIITADHTGPSKHSYYSGRMGMFRVPLVVYYPGINPGTDSSVISHPDIFPWIASAVPTGRAIYSLGQAPDEKPAYVIHYLNGLYQIFDREYLLLHDGRQQEALYAYQADSLLKVNLLHTYPEEARRLEAALAQRLKWYFKGMRENKMTAE